MFSSSKEVKRDSYETWKEEKQAQVDRKRKKEQEEMDVEQNNITAGKTKSLRIDLSSSGTLQPKINYKNIILSCSSDSRLRGDAVGAGETVQEGGDGVQGGNKEVTAEKVTWQRAGLGEQSKTDV